ncbi:MAG: IclR family transcriptional regulator [Desulfobaccales bacterium]
MPVRAVDRALAIMDALRQDVQGLSELSRGTNLPKATLLRILGSLIDHECVVYDQETQKYDLGIKVLKLGMTVSERLDLKKVGQPYLRRIWDISEETVYLNIRIGDERLSIDCLNGKRSVRVVAYAGHSSPLHVAASGKAILAFLDQREIDDYIRRVKFEKVAPGTINDADALRENLAKIREQGYATSFEERLLDAKGASAPIRDITGKVVASISITVPNSRTDEEFGLYIRLVVDAAKEISKKLGASRQYIQGL